ncbi:MULTISPECIES: cytochrome c [unclassified Dyella]|uniref:cytochrome c n=1 Tax=unclassified Dyella TaxID=2634549 RepID=UPI000C816EFF|nr:MULTISPECIES: cytochrome c [unclassified Dyella]MDR3444309.1 cytochrome c [Dyella sp.]PMQ03940.1 Alcohol dehydrogenase cytochrome c subunit [Dyella sp. AD56]
MKRIVIIVVALLLIAGGWWLFRSETRQPVPPSSSKVGAATLKDPVLIAKGHYLAIAGDCASCHTAQGGERFAGGRVLPTPFGNIPSPNITPDGDTGLGEWSFEDFWQALHSGKGRHGEFLYPVFSYTSFTKVTRDDALAIFAYLQSLAPVHAPAQAPTLEFPYSVRNSLKAWRALYFHEGEFQRDASKSDAWNRGAYLVQGLGHCNECHAPRDSLGGQQGSASLAGGQIPAQNWYAPDLSMQANGGLAGWSEQDIVDLLKTGQSARGTAFGPMAEVVAQSTQHMHEDDLRAMATYLQSLPPRTAAVTTTSELDTRAILAQGAKVYAERCADCHGKDGNGAAGIYPPLNGNSSVNEPTGINATRVVLLGGFAPVTEGNARPYSMPPFAQQLSDADVAAVVTYIRQSWSNKASIVMERDVAQNRHTPID